MRRTIPVEPAEPIEPAEPLPCHQETPRPRLTLSSFSTLHCKVPCDIVLADENQGRLCDPHFPRDF